MPSPTTGAVTPVPTHCPYCSLQCGMTLTPREQGAGPVLEVAGRELPDQPRRALREGPLVGRAARPPRPADRRPLVRDHRDEPFREATWDEAYDRIATALTVAQERHGRDAAGLLRRRRADQREGLPGRQVRPGRAAQRRRSTTTAASACRRPRPRRPRRSGSTAGMPFPLADIARADTVLLVGSNPADTMPPAMRWFAAGRERGARHLVVDPRYTATAATRRRAPAAGARHRPRAGQRAAAPRDQAPARRRGLRRRAHHRLAARSGARCASTGPTASSGSPASRCAVMERAVHLLAASRATMILSARGAEQHAKGSDTALAWINLALALGLPGRPVLRAGRR